MARCRRSDPAGQERQALVLNNDLAPTLSMLGGATPALACDGRDLSPLFAQDLPPGWRRRILVEHYRDVSGFPVSFSDYFAVRTGVNEVSGGAQAKLVAWSIDGTPNGTEQYGLVQDPQETASMHAEGGVAAANRAALRASLEVLRHCGAAGGRSCLDAERDVEAIFFGGFD